MIKDFKSSLGCMMWVIHSIVLSSLASVVAENLGWNAWLQTGAWVAGAAIGLIPFVRTLCLFLLLLGILVWWKALLATAGIAFALMFVEALGKAKMTRERRIG